MLKKFKEKTFQTLKSNYNQKNQTQNEGINTIENFKARKISFYNSHKFEQSHNNHQNDENNNQPKKGDSLIITNKPSPNSIIKTQKIKCFINNPTLNESRNKLIVNIIKLFKKFKKSYHNINSSNFQASSNGRMRIESNLEDAFLQKEENDNLENFGSIGNNHTNEIIRLNKLLNEKEKEIKDLKEKLISALKYIRKPRNKSSEIINNNFISL